MDVQDNFLSSTAIVKYLTKKNSSAGKFLGAFYSVDNNLSLQFCLLSSALSRMSAGGRVGGGFFRNENFYSKVNNTRMGTSINHQLQQERISIKVPTMK